MIIFTTTLIFVALAKGESDPLLLHALSDEFIHYINSAQNSWTAGRNFHPNMSMDYLKKIQGNIKVDHQSPIKEHLEEDDIAELPEYFDAREKWPYCKSLNEIRDQGNCGNSWALAPASVLTDHFCTQSEGNVDFHVSAIDLTSCVQFNRVCEDGNTFLVWDYIIANGVVSGGNYNSTTGCKPYPFKNCNHHQVANNSFPDCADVHEKYDKCEKKCISKDMDYFDKQMIFRRKFVMYPTMRQQIYKMGPLQVDFDVYADFLSYKKGVYEHTVGELLGSQTVKIIGWGVDNGVKYWLVANSWNESWGDKGFFKIRRGSNHCHIESNGLMPLVNKP